MFDHIGLKVRNLETSVGFATGGPIGNKDFPVPNDWLNIPGFGFIGKLVGNGMGLLREETHEAIAAHQHQAAPQLRLKDHEETEQNRRVQVIQHLAENG